MDDPKRPADDADAQDELQRIRELILQRRNRFIAAALAGVGAASSACGDSHRGPMHPIVRPVAGASGSGGQPSVCLGLTPGTAGTSPRVCLSVAAPADSGVVPIAGTSASGPVAGAAPRVCLSAPYPCPDGGTPPCAPVSEPEDAGVEDASR
jgi:hypothetical protein